MSPEERKHLVRTFYTEVASSEDPANLEAYVSPDYVDHNAPDGERGPNAVRKHVTGLRTTFPDFRIRVLQILREGEFVITRVEGEGTHLGAWMGIAPSNRKIRLKGINIDRVRGGKIVEHWGEADTVGMLLQMGVNPFAGRSQSETPGEPPF